MKKFVLWCAGIVVLLAWVRLGVGVLADVGRNTWIVRVTADAPNKRCNHELSHQDSVIGVLHDCFISLRRLSLASLTSFARPPMRP